MNTIIGKLNDHSVSEPNRIAFTFIDDSGKEETISYSELEASARIYANAILDIVQEGDGVILMVPQGLEYIKSFFGCLYAGVVAVPLYPPQSKKHADKADLVLDESCSKLILTNDLLIDKLTEHYDSRLGITCLNVSKLVVSREQSLKKVARESTDSLVFLQYTSGSTSNPKGVMISHVNMIANFEALIEATGCNQLDIFCHWLPLFHDLGLINTLLLPVYLGAHSIIMSPLRFIKRPFNWFKAIDKYKATIAGAPNFGFEQCVKRIKSEYLTQIDLSSWKIAFNAAEPIDGDVILKFNEKFAPCGFTDSAFYPSYGMAEATVFISGGDVNKPPIMTSFSQENLNQGKVVVTEIEQDCIVLVACGKSQSNHNIQIVDPESNEAVDINEVGEICFTGPSVSQGYWQDQTKTDQNFMHLNIDNTCKYLKTGDLGFIHGGELYIAGRIKDVIIINGRNYYPQDIEKVCFKSNPCLKYGGCVAFEQQGKVVLVQEVERGMIKKTDFNQLSNTIRSQLFQQEQLFIYNLVFIKSNTLPRTSSGKVQRHLVKSLYINDELPYVFKLRKSTSSGDYQAPQTETEKWLADCWGELLGVEKVSVNADFFELGGESISAIKLVADINSHLKVNIELKSIFSHSILGQLSELIQQKQIHVKNVNPHETIKKHTISPGQEQLWFMHKLMPESSQYNVSAAFEVHGPLKVDILKKLIYKLILRHFILRTCYQDGVEGISNKILTDFNHGFTVFDAKNIDVKDVLNQAQKKPFNLQQDLMIRCLVICKTDHEFLLNFTFHHIAIDGMSLDIFAKELSQLYEFEVNSQIVNLPAFASSYNNFSNWQHQLLSNNQLEQSILYWQQKLSGIPQVHNLPINGPRSKTPRCRGSGFKKPLDAVLLTELKVMTRQFKYTPFMVIEAALACVMSKYSGEKDIVIGFPISIRENDDFQHVMGYFINVLPLRTDLKGDPSFYELLSQTQVAFTEAYTHRLVPFKEIAEGIKSDGDLSYNPVFQVFLTYQQDYAASLELAQTTIKKVDEDIHSTKFDLTLNVVEKDDSLELNWEYATDLFDEQSIIRLSENFEKTLANLIIDPERPVSQSFVNTKKEQLQLKQFSENISKEEKNTSLLHHQFEAIVLAHRNKIAVEVSDVKFTYDMLNNEVNQVAHFLIEQGVSIGTVVAVCLKRSIELIVVLLAVIKVGGVYLPIDQRNPKKRINKIIKEGNPQLLISQNKFKLLFDDTIVQKIYIDSNETINKIDSYNELGNPNVHFFADAAAYLIFTSGTTGNPKGILVTHGNVANFLDSMRKKPGFTSEDRLLAITSVSFDIHVLEIFLPLTTGGEVVLATDSDTADGMKLANLLMNKAITVIQATPSTWQLLLESNVLSRLSEVKALCGGEELKKPLADAIKQKVGSLWNMYGPTETTVWSACAEFFTDTERIHVGKPIDQTVIYVLDDSLQQQPIGVLGEIYIGGVGKANMYINEETPASQKFIKNHFMPQGDNLLYQTGDIGRWLSDGNLEVIGRRDNQVKIRGYRVELREIEIQLDLLNNVQKSVVIKKDLQSGHSIICAFIQLKRDFRNVDETKIIEGFRQELIASLPSYMVPTEYILIEAFQLTHAGKVDVSTLTNFKLQDKPRNKKLTKTLNEQKIGKIWADLLGLDSYDIRLEDNFFHLGGNSILLMRLISTIKRMCGCQLTIAEVYNALKLNEMAVLVEVEQVKESLPIKAAILDLSTNYLASSAQKRLWFLNQMDHNSSAYNMCKVFNADQIFDLQLAEKAFNEIISRHEPLRTTYQEIDGELVQIIHDEWNFKIDNRKEKLSVEGCSERIKDELKKPFDLSSGLMIRVTYLCTDQNRFMVFNMHHIAADGWSILILIKEFVELYSAYFESKEASLDALEVSFKDYTYWMSDQMSDEVLAINTTYWNNKLAGIPTVHNLSLDHRRCLDKPNAGLVTEQLSQKVAGQVLEFCEIQCITPFLFVQASFSILLSRLSNEEDIVIGVPNANREKAEFQSLIGLFIDTQVVRTQVNPNKTFFELLNEVKKTFIDDSFHREIPFEHLVEEINPKRSLLHAPIFQILLNMDIDSQDSFKMIEKIGLDNVNEYDYPENKYDISLYVSSGRELSFKWVYNANIFNSSTIETFASEFSFLIKMLLTHPFAKISSHGWKNSNSWNQVIPCQIDDAKNVLELFQNQVQKTPFVIAINDSEGTITYQELNIKSNQLARYLFEQHGASESKNVVVLQERSLNRAIAILAILKSGMAFVPISADIPDDRKKFMIEDCKADLLIFDDFTRDAVTALLGGGLLMTKVVNFQQCENEFSDFDSSELDLSPINRETISHIIYTSGSTGLPKGVLGNHSALLNRVNWMLNEFPYTENETVSHLTSMSFIRGIWELMVPLCGGARIELFSREVVKQPTLLLKRLNELGISRLVTAPSLLKEICKLEEIISTPPQKTAIKYWFISGEFLRKEIVLKAKQYFPEVVFYNLYGSTEVVSDVLYHKLDNIDGKSIALGRPIHGTSATIVDVAINPVPRGIVGEIIIVGESLTLGYVGQEELSAKVFINTPIGRGYRTGDMGRQSSSDGSIYFEGRRDHQLKIRGYRIELHEIEHQISKIDIIDDTVVVSNESLDGVSLVAFVSYSNPKLEQGYIQGEKLKFIRSELLKFLPDYMVPAFFIGIDKIPRTLNGKVNKSSLPNIDKYSLNLDVITPQTDVQEYLRTTWSSVLKLDQEQICITSNFFELGGHSLQVSNIIQKIKKDHSCKMSFLEFFEQRTLEEMASFIDQQQVEKTYRNKVVI